MAPGPWLLDRHSASIRAVSFPGTGRGWIPDDRRRAGRQPHLAGHGRCPAVATAPRVSVRHLDGHRFAEHTAPPFRTGGRLPLAVSAKRPRLEQFLLRL